MITPPIGLHLSKKTANPEVNIQFLRKQSNGTADCYVLFDFDIGGVSPEINDPIINKTDNILVKCHSTGMFHTFIHRSAAETFCVRVPGSEIVWDRNAAVFVNCTSTSVARKKFVSLEDIPPADEKDVDAFFVEMAQGVNCDAVELADSEFVDLLETLTHKKLSETHKNILFKVLNSNI